MLIYLAMIDTPEDREKFVDIYNRYKDYLHRLAFDIVQNCDDAEDVVQETFFYLAKNLRKIKESSSPQTTVFLSLVCEHKAIDVIRLRSRYGEFAFDDNDEEYGIVSDFYTGNKLADAILQLKADDREIILLRFYYGFSITEISKLIKKTYNATQRMILRAKDSLLDIMKKED